MLKQAFSEPTCVVQLYMTDAVFIHTCIISNVLFWSRLLLKLYIKKKKDKQTEKDEQDVRNNSLLGLLREVFPCVVEKVDKFRACFQSVMENEGHSSRIKSKLKCPRTCFPCWKVFSKLSQLHFLSLWIIFQLIHLADKMNLFSPLVY